MLQFDFQKTFFFMIYTTYRKKKTITRLDDFFSTRVTFFTRGAGFVRGQFRRESCGRCERSRNFPQRGGCALWGHPCTRLSHAIPLSGGVLEGIWQQLCDHVVAMHCDFGASFLCMFFCCVLYSSHLGTWHLEVWGLQGSPNHPQARSPPCIALDFTNGRNKSVLLSMHPFRKRCALRRATRDVEGYMCACVDHTDSIVGFLKIRLLWQKTPFP